LSKCTRFVLNGRCIIIHPQLAKRILPVKSILISVFQGGFMFRKSIFILTVLLIVGFYIGPTARAQAPHPEGQNINPVGFSNFPGAPSSLQAAQVSGKPASASIALGKPGVSYRYTKTFGETEVAYPPDNSHLNYPWGLDTDGTNVWIGELWGNRALKYNQTGAFLSQIGVAGNADTNNTTLSGIADIAVDSSGNTWLVDSDASHVVEFDPSGNKLGELGSPGNNGTGNDRFNNPQSIVFDAGGNIYVSDGAPWYDTSIGNHRVQIFNSAGSYLATIGQTGACGVGNDHLCGPRHIAIYGTQLYISDAGNQRIQIFDISTPASPAYVATIGVSDASGDDNGHFNNPSGVAVDASYIYVADLWNSRVQVFNRVTRAYVTTIGTGWGSANNQFEYPSDVAVDASGYLYVADFVNTRVQQFSQSAGVWTYVRTYGVTSVPYITDGAHFNHPSSVAVGSNGSIYIAEEFGHRLVKLNANGALNWAIGAAGVKGDWNDANDRLNNPADVALDSNGKIYVADRWHGRVQIYNPDSSYFATVGNLACPGGVGIAPNNYLHVANTCANTVDIYNTSLVLVATLGVSGVPGSDNSHFNSPADVAVDSNGLIYVADNLNQRVQVFDSSRVYLRTIGETGVAGYSFSQLNGPDGLTVDAHNDLFVADTNNNRIQVFDPSGAYLSTIGGSWGDNQGRLKAPVGVGVDLYGNVYIADWGNHRIQKFALGVPGWKQSNINGFGEIDNQGVWALSTFNNTLYAGTLNPAGTGAQIWRLDALTGWQQVMGDGFGDATNYAIDHMLAYGGYLYAGTMNCADNNCTSTNGGQLWRSSDGTHWNPITTDGFGNTGNGEIFRLAVLNSQICANTWDYTSSPSHGAQIWCSATGNAGTWSILADGGFGNTHNIGMPSMLMFGNSIFVGTLNSVNGGQVWRKTGGGSWSQVNSNGFGDSSNTSITAMDVFNDQLYAITRSSTHGAEVYRCSLCDNSDWQEVEPAAFLNSNNNWDHGLLTVKDKLYVVIGNSVTGLEVWQTADGQNWTQSASAGLGDANNYLTYWGNAMVDLNNALFIGTTNYANGAEIWQKMEEIYVPIAFHPAP
jgi:hypothetical protein